MYLKNQELDKAKKELDKALSIDANNTMTLRYLKEVEELTPAEEERTHKKKEAIVYQSGNETVIQPVNKKDRTVLQTVVNMLIGLVIGVGVAWFMILPAKIQQARDAVNEKYKEVSELLDAKTVDRKSVV